MLAEGVRQLDSVSKSAGVLRQTTRIHHVLQLPRHAFTPNGFTNLDTDTAYFEQLAFMARHLHFPAVGK